MDNDKDKPLIFDEETWDKKTNIEKLNAIYKAFSTMQADTKPLRDRLKELEKTKKEILDSMDEANQMADKILDMLGNPIGNNKK